MSKICVYQNIICVSTLPFSLQHSLTVCFSSETSRHTLLILHCTNWRKFLAELHVRVVAFVISIHVATMPNMSRALTVSLILNLVWKDRYEPPRGKPTMWFPNRSDTNRPVQAQKRARSLKFRI